MYQCPIRFRFDAPSAHTAITSTITEWFADNGWGTPPQSGVRHRLPAPQPDPAGPDAPQECGPDGPAAAGPEPFAAHVSRRERGTGAHSGQYVVDRPGPPPVRGATPGPGGLASAPRPAPPAPGGAAGPAAPGKAGGSAARGRLRTTITYSVDGDGGTGWLLIVHECDAPIARTPAIARRLLRALGGLDAGHPIPSGAPMIQPPALPAVVDALADPARTRPMLVVGSAHALPLRKFADLIGGLVDDADGLLCAYVLDGPATAAFDQAAAEPMRVGPGCARLFSPIAHAGPGDGGGRPAGAPPIDSRAIGIDRLVSDEYGLRRELWHLALRAAQGAPLPSDVARTADALRERIETCRYPVARPPRTAEPRTSELRTAGARAAEPPAAAPTPGPLPADAEPEPAQPEPPRTRAGGLPGGTLGALLEDVLDDVCGDPQITHAALGRLRTLARRGLRRTREHEADRAECARLAAELEDAQDTIGELRARLDASAPQAHDTTASPRAEGGDDAPPDTFAELVARIGNVPGVRFTGSPRSACRLDSQAQSRTYARKAWRTIEALSDYASARLAAGGPSSVRDYLERTPAGKRAVSQHNHSSVESDTTAKSPSYRTPRTLPVPDYVHPDGRVFMGAHFKLGGGNISPRLHYYDDTARSGIVYIGYIGEHLPNQSTN